jgi:hypothetical protein
MTLCPVRQRLPERGVTGDGAPGPGYAAVRATRRIALGHVGDGAAPEGAGEGTSLAPVNSELPTARELRR